MTSSNRNISALLALCAGNSPVTGEFPSQRPVTQRFDVFFDLRLTEQLSKQSWSWWFETPSRSLWLHFNVAAIRPTKDVDLQRDTCTHSGSENAGKRKLFFHCQNEWRGFDGEMSVRRYSYIRNRKFLFLIFLGRFGVVNFWLDGIPGIRMDRTRNKMTHTEARDHFIVRISLKCFVLHGF